MDPFVVMVLRVLGSLPLLALAGAYRDRQITKGVNGACRGAREALTSMTEVLTTSRDCDRCNGSYTNLSGHSTASCDLEIVRNIMES